MECAAQAVPGEVPASLARWPEGPDVLLRRVSALILLYPYCGILNSAAPDRWQGAGPAGSCFSSLCFRLSAPRLWSPWVSARCCFCSSL